jgi:hypothetical protein
MGLFSHRKGLRPVKSQIQADSMDQELRNGLWNALAQYYWENVKLGPYQMVPSLSYQENRNVLILCRRLWLNYFKVPIDTLQDYWPEVHKTIRSYFFGCAWNEVYDMVEFVASNYPDEYDRITTNFRTYCNQILEREVSAYRFVAEKITQITDEREMATVEEATDTAGSLKPAAIHMRAALNLLADRKSPDYRNSIKESISAVEAACKVMAGEEKADLDKALKQLKKQLGLHGALEKAFSSMYGYSSDADGIRHALMDEPNLAFEDAKFMLVACAAFVNYLKAKAARAGMKI